MADVNWTHVVDNIEDVTEMKLVDEYKDELIDEKVPKRLYDKYLKMINEMIKNKCLSEDKVIVESIQKKLTELECEKIYVRSLTSDNSIEIVNVKFEIGYDGTLNMFILSKNEDKIYFGECGSHSFIICKEFYYGNSDGSCDSVNVNICDDKKFLFRAKNFLIDICNDEFH
jgi:hypothetical protein